MDFLCPICGMLVDADEIMASIVVAQQPWCRLRFIGTAEGFARRQDRYKVEGCPLLNMPVTA